MEQTLQDITHFARIISGCESINYVNNNGGLLTDDGRYAQSVLRLHAQDEFGALAGNESILSGIKKGAKKLKEWIASLIKAVKEFITGSGKKKKALEEEIKKLKSTHDKLTTEDKKKVDDKLETSGNPYVAVFDRILTKLEKAQSEGQGEAFSEIGYKPALTTAIDDTKNAKKRAEEGAVFMAVISLQLASKRLDAELNSVVGKLATFANGEETPKKNSAASTVAAWVNTVTTINHSIVTNTTSLNKKVHAALDEFMTGGSTSSELKI